MTIVDWVKKAQKGDSNAYLKLFEQYEQHIYRIAYVYVKNQEDALDVVQETAYKSFKSIATLREPAYFKTWLVRIAISCSMDILRQRAKIVHFKQDIQEAAAEEAEDIPLALSLKDLIDTLDEEEKSVIILRFYYDYTIKEVTTLLEIPLGTGKTILYRALKKLRKRAEEAAVYEQ